MEAQPFLRPAEEEKAEEAMREMAKIYYENWQKRDITDTIEDVGDAIADAFEF